MFNLKDKTQLDQVRIIGESQRAKISNTERTGWGFGFAEAAQQVTTEKPKKPSTGNPFRVRIYNVY